MSVSAGANTRLQDAMNAELVPRTPALAKRMRPGGALPKTLRVTSSVHLGKQQGVINVTISISGRGSSGPYAAAPDARVAPASWEGLIQHLARHSLVNLGERKRVSMPQGVCTLQGASTLQRVRSVTSRGRAYPGQGSEKQVLVTLQPMKRNGKGRNLARYHSTGTT